MPSGLKNPHPLPWSLALLKKGPKTLNKAPTPCPRPQNRGGEKIYLRFFCPTGQKNRLKKLPRPGAGVGGWGFRPFIKKAKLQGKSFKRFFAPQAGRKTKHSLCSPTLKGGGRGVDPEHPYE